MEINKFAKDNDLAQKFEAAIGHIDRGRGWAPFAGLDKGEVTVKVIYDGQIRFVALEKPKPKKKTKKKVKPGEVITSSNALPPETLTYEVKTELIERQNELAQRYHDGELTADQYRELSDKLDKEMCVPDGQGPDKEGWS